MTRDPAAAARARKAEAKADGVISIQLGAGAAGGAVGGGGTGAIPGGGGAVKKGGFKKSGFKSAFAPVGGGAAEDEEEAAEKPANGKKESGMQGETAKRVVLGGSMESDTEDEGYEMYDPRFPTD